MATKKPNPKKPSEDYAKTRLHIHTVLARLEYVTERLKKSIEILDTEGTPTALDLIRTRGFAYSYAGLHEAAAADLAVVVSQKEGRAPVTLSKYAQVLIRIGGEENFKRAIEISETVLEQYAKADPERWLAHQNIGLAKLGLGDRKGAARSAKEALKFRKDPRSHALIALTETDTRASALRSTIEGRGLLPDAKLNVLPPDKRQEIDYAVLLYAESNPISMA